MAALVILPFRFSGMFSASLLPKCGRARNPTIYRPKTIDRNRRG